MLNYAFSFGVAISSLLICVVNLIYTFILGRTDKLQNRIFITIECILVVNSITGIISAVYSASEGLMTVAPYGLEINRYVYFATHTALSPMFFYYVSNVSLVSTRFDNLKTRIVAVPFIITEAMALFNPLTNWVWSFDEQFNFHREWGEMLIYLAALIYFVLAFIVFLRSWEFISKKRKLAIMFSFVLVAIGVVLQLVNKELKVEVLTEVVGFTGVMMLVENEDDRMDLGMGFYNRAALSLDLGGCIRHHRWGSVIAVHINNYDIINRIVGGEESNVMMDIVSDYLRSVVERYFVYISNPDTIVILMLEKAPHKIDPLVDKLSERFEKTWDYKDFRIQLDATIMVAEFPNQIKNVSEMFYMIESPIPKNDEKAVLRGHDLDYIIRRQAVENAISRGFAENSFEVYYQPTYNIDGKLHGAEALARMHDKELGNVYPDEFIPIAEQTGMIDDLDDFVLEEVCKFIKSGIPKKYGIDNVNVNLSVVQCMRLKFVEHIKSIAERYGIEKRCINFEITESIAANDYGTLSNVINQLKKEGFMFSMDDYGTGYSNVSAIFSLNLDVVKIDKSLLWGAEKSEMGMVILENTIRMIQQMNKKILVEGVETADQITLLKKLKVDYLQGFYYSKPIPKDEFIELISIPRRG